MMMYESTSEFNLNRAEENIKLAKQVFKRELAKRDEVIQGLHKKIEVLQFESREFAEFKMINEKNNRELMSTTQHLKHQISLEQSENERLKDEISRLRMDLSAEIDKSFHLEAEHEKANHIIKNLIRKIQFQPGLQPKTV